MHGCVTCLVLGLIVCACVGFVVDWYGLTLFTVMCTCGVDAVVGFCFEARGCLGYMYGYGGRMKVFFVEYCG